MGTVDNSLEKILYGYMDLNANENYANDYISVDIRHYASGRRNDGMSYVNTASSVQSTNFYEMIQGTAYSDATKRFSYIARFRDPPNSSNKDALARRHIVDGDYYIFIEAEFKNHYSNEDIISMIDMVEAKARSLILLSASPASPAPSATKAPTVSASPSPSGWQWPGWATLETTPPQSLPEGESMVRSWSGRVEVMRAGTSEWEPARNGAHLDVGAKVRTLVDGKTELLLSGGRVVRLDPESVLEIPIKYPVKTMGDYLRLIKGEFWLIIYKGRFQCITPNAIAGVKGTEFLVVVNDSGTMVSVLEGVVEVSSLNFTGNVSVGANQIVIVPADGVPRAPAGFDATKVDRWWEAFPPLPDDFWTASPGPTTESSTPAKQTSPMLFAMGSVVSLLAVVYLLGKKRST
jgi:ferric-dicitrate binding protein FerR (iron transport regulator)